MQKKGHLEQLFEYFIGVLDTKISRLSLDAIWISQALRTAMYFRVLCLFLESDITKQ